jgi:hypothetical protein
MNRCFQLIAVALLIATPFPASAAIISGSATVTTRAAVHARTTGYNGAHPDLTASVDDLIQEEKQTEGTSNGGVGLSNAPQASVGSRGAARAEVKAVQNAKASWNSAGGSAGGQLSGTSAVTALAKGVLLDFNQVVDADSLVSSSVFVQNSVLFDTATSIRGVYALSSNYFDLQVNGNALGGSGSFDLLSLSSANFQLIMGASASAYETADYSSGLPVLFGSPFGTGSGAAALVWGIGTIPGETPDVPLLPSSIDLIYPDENEPTSESVKIAGTRLTFPIFEKYGYTDFVYVDPAIATGYLYEAEGANFASFVVPYAMPGGDDMFELAFDGFRESLHAGQEFDFTDFVTDGVKEFRLLGIDPGENLDPTGLPPFVSGYKFTNEGVVTVTQWSLADQNAAVPEPASLAIWGGIGIAGLVAGWRKGRKQVST